MMTRAHHRTVLGFTFVEVMIVLALGAVVVGALYRALLSQQRFYRRERAATYRQETLRSTASMLAINIREARGVDGDFSVLGPDSLGIRVPVGFGIVCVTDTENDLVGLTDIQGRVAAVDDDSLLVFHPDGWLVRHAVEADPATETALSCAYDSGPQVDLRLRLDGTVEGVPVGAPVRAFRRYLYRLESDADSWWLAREGSGSTDILAGPFEDTGSGLMFSYLDADGQTTADPAQVARIDLTLVAQHPSVPAKTDTLRVSISPRNR